MPPISRISDSPTTTTPREEICCPIPVMFDTVRKWLFSTAPTTMSMARTGSSAASRSQEIAAALRLRRRSSADSTSAASAAMLSLISLMANLHALAGRDQRLAVEGRVGELGEDLPAHQHEHAAADDQVVKLVAGQQQARAGFGGDPVELGEQQFLGGHVYPPGGGDGHDHHRVAGQGPGHGHLLLV